MSLVTEKVVYKANVKRLSDMSDAKTLDDSSYFLVAQNGDSKRISYTQLSSMIAGKPLNEIKQKAYQLEKAAAEAGKKIEKLSTMQAAKIESLESSEKQIKADIQSISKSIAVEAFNTQKALSEEESQRKKDFNSAADALRDIQKNISQLSSAFSQSQDGLQKTVKSLKCIDNSLSASLTALADKAIVATQANIDQIKEDILSQKTAIAQLSADVDKSSAALSDIQNAQTALSAFITQLSSDHQSYKDKDIIQLSADVNEMKSTYSAAKKDMHDLAGKMSIFIVPGVSKSQMFDIEGKQTISVAIRKDGYQPLAITAVEVLDENGNAAQDAAALDRYIASSSQANVSVESKKKQKLQLRLIACYIMEM